MEFTTTERGKRKLLRNGYMYVHRRNLSEGSSMWECIYWRKGYQCNANVKLSPLDELHEQTYALLQTECQVTKVKSGIKRRAEETEGTTQQILSTELRNISNEVAANLPSLETLRRNIHHSRQHRNMLPTLAHREDISDLPQTYRTTVSGDSFLVYDSGVGDKERTFIFASQDALHFLVDSRHWYADGTFVCPEIFFHCIIYMVSVTEEFFLVSSHFCQIKTKALTVDYLNSYSNS